MKKGKGLFWKKLERNPNRDKTKRLDYYAAGLCSVSHSIKKVQSGLVAQRMKKAAKPFSYQILNQSFINENQIF